MTNSVAMNETFAIHLPLPPCVDGNLENQKFEMAVYARFMRHLRYSGRTSEAVKVLEAMRFVADLMDHSESHIAKVLTDLGMRAPRSAYPQAFLAFADNAMVCSAWQLGAADAELKALHSYWVDHGEMHCSPQNQAEDTRSRFSGSSEGAHTVTVGYRDI